MSADTGFMHWWLEQREHGQFDHSAMDRIRAQEGWDACKEAARQAVVDSAGLGPMGAQPRRALDRIDSL